MIKHRKRSSTKTGLPPGSAVYVGEHAPQATRFIAHVYDNHSYVQIKSPKIAEINEALVSNKQVWLDIYGLGDAQEISHYCTEFSIHPLIVEDILNTGQRPKLDILPDGLFIVFKLLNEEEHHLTYHSEQFSLIAKNNLLITFRESNHFNFSMLYERLDTSHSIIRDHGVDYLTYLIMDAVVDNYLHLVEEAEASLTDIEELLIHSPEKVSLNTLYTIKRRNMTLRKTIAPLRDIVHLLLSEHSRLINPQYLLYYRDLHDHCIRLVELINLHHEMATGMLEIYLSSLNTHMNETIKVLTLFASLFIPLTFIVGVYGMNFSYMPELTWHYGYAAVWAIMLALTGGMLYYFKRKKLI